LETLGPDAAAPTFVEIERAAKAIYAGAKCAWNAVTEREVEP